MDQSSSTLTKIINDNFEIEVAGKDFEKLRQHLITRIQFLLQHHSEKLWWILYRIDVSENKAIEDLKAEPQDKGAERLADLVIERQVQKMKTRREFQGDAGDF